MKRALIPLMVVVSLVVVIYLMASRLPAIPESNKTGSGSVAGPIGLLEKPQVLPEFKFIDADNRSLSLEDFRGKVLLLNIWATWCPPCRQEMPSLDRLQARLGGKDFMVLPLSTDLNGLVSVTRFYKSAGIQSLGIYLDPTDDVSTALRVPGLPTTFLIDREGRTLGVRVGPAEWDSEQSEAMIRQQLQARPE
jgi:thiol-disulfide isomerase/thioredoxin